MIVTLKDGSKKEYAEAKSVIDIAYDISEGLARAACAGEVNGEVVDLRTVIDSDCELNILTAKDEKGLAVLRHTASHVLAQAVQTLFPDAKVAIGPSLDFVKRSILAPFLMIFFISFSIASRSSRENGGQSKS